MNDDEPDDERLFERAAAALRTPHPRDAAVRDNIVHLVHVESAGRWAGSVMRLPWWAAAAAAAAAFAIGIGTGRTLPRHTVIAGVAPAPVRVATLDPQAANAIEFVFVSPAARNVSLVGDFNGWDASATPMQRLDGKTTWSVAVRLPPGLHLYAFVVDGETWVVDPQAPLSAERSFGQRKSVVVVPGDQRS
jgi:hypothetical protein